MMNLRSTVLVGAMLVAGWTAGARAGTISAAEVSYDMAMLSQFNLVALGNYQATGLGWNSIDGRVIVGGNVTSAAGAGMMACAQASACTGATQAIDGTNQRFGALTVFGAMSGYNAVLNAPSGSAAAVRGNATGYFYAGGTTSLAVGGTTTGLTVDVPGAVTTVTGFRGTLTRNSNAITPSTASAAAVFPFNNSGIGSEARTLSKGIANLPGSPGVSAKSLTVGDNVFFTASTDYTYLGKKYSVITTTVADLARETNFRGINNANASDSIFVIVTGDGANYTLPNLNSYADANKVIFNFVDATTLRFAGNWNGSILAPLATITQMGGAIDGSVVVSAINQTNALYANNLFTGTLQGLVPEPASIALVGVGIAAASLLRRRRAA